jgi:N-acetylglucosaminyldiphosphoundecaprenol N-acetyl-beta-D-mannosaminyltransferase
MPMLKNFFDIAFSTGSVDDIRRMIAKAARAPETAMLVTPNVDHVVALAHKLTAEEKAVYESANIFVCDSKIIGRLALLHDIDLTPRTGTDRAFDLLNSPQDSDLVFALAGPTHEQTELMRQRYPQHRFVHNALWAQARQRCLECLRGRGRSGGVAGTLVLHFVSAAGIAGP